MSHYTQLEKERIATLTPENQTGVHDKVIQKILRHSNVSTTTTYYIKSTASDVAEAMQKFAENLEGQNLRDSDGTVKTGSGASGQLVN